jgi:energy-coupling factor transporter ATP-binding protein EcfA2
MSDRSPDDAPWIEARGIRVRRGACEVLAGVDLAARPGELVVVSGANGSGKSTLLEVIALLRAPDAGRLALFGEPARADDVQLRRRVTLAMQPALLLKRTVLQNVQFGLRARGVAREAAVARAQEALDLTGVGALAQRRIGGLSAGERQRVNLARALALPVEILLLDEPTANLDARGADLIRALLRRLAEAGRHAIVVATPDEAAIAADATRVVRLEARLGDRGG